MIKKLFRLLFKLMLWFIGLTVLWVLVFKYVSVPFTPYMVIRAMQDGDDYKFSHQWVPLEEISPHLQLAVICAEDQKFVHHRGFDREAIEKARASNREGGRLRGASTISQQTAKNVFLWPARSWLRKGFEAYFTFLIETFWSKERILEVYLNSIEMGHGVYGAEAASQYWFDKKASSLSKENAAAIASILPNPRVYQANPPGPYISKRITWTLQQMRYYGPLELTINKSSSYKE